MVSANSNLSFKEELIVIDQQEKSTVESISLAFQQFRKACDEREHNLLQQCHGIYSTRRKQLIEFTDESDIEQGKSGHSHSKESKKFVKKWSPVSLSNDLEELKLSFYRLLSKVQLLSPANNKSMNEIDCVAGFTKTVILDPSASNNTVADGRLNEITPNHGTTVVKNNGHISCQFDAPSIPGEYMLRLPSQEKQVLVNISVRPYPSRLDVPVYEFVKANARYCTIRNGKMYVSNRQIPFVNVFDVNTGIPLGTMGGEFKKGRGIVAMDDYILVADASRSEFAKISHNRKYETTWFGKGELTYPLGMKMAPDGKLYVTSMKAKQIVIFKQGVGENEDWVVDKVLKFDKKPYDLAFDSNGDMHVAFGDKDEKVQGAFVYSRSGESLRVYGQDFVQRAGGIHIDKNDYCYITEYYENGRLVILNSSGELMSSSKPLDYPMGVCVDEDGSVFVASNFSHHVLQF